MQTDGSQLPPEVGPPSLGDGREPADVDLTATPDADEPPSSSELRVQAAVGRLSELDDTDPSDQVAVYEEIHESLRDALAGDTEQTHREG